VKSVKDKWLKGKGENTTVKIVIHDAGLDNGLLLFGTKQLACNLTIARKSWTFMSRTRLTPFFPLSWVGVIKNAKWLLTLQGRGR
jgi:hypothetical protein